MRDTPTLLITSRRMQYDLSEVFQQASEDHSACRYDTKDYDSYLSHGIKIVKDNYGSKIIIMDTTQGEYYQEVSAEDYYLFQTKGWLYGIYVLSLSSHKDRVERLNEEIKSEVNNRKRKRTLLALREERELVLKNYSKVNQLLIKLNDNE